MARREGLNLEFDELDRRILEKLLIRSSKSSERTSLRRL
jgi:hypothetical protein